MSLAFTDLDVRHGKVAVIRGASATFPGGGITALIGPNGAGKSTLMRALAGLMPCHGTITLEGRPQKPADLRSDIAYMPQDTSATSSLTLVEVVLLGRLGSLGLSVPATLVAEAEAALARFGLAPLAGRTLDAVSGGQRQLAYLAQALFRQPRVLMLDEPTAALDLRHQLMVLETIQAIARREGIVVVVAMHDISLAVQFADRIACLSGGQLAPPGPPEEIITPTRLRHLYGVEAEIATGADGRPRILALRSV